MDQGGVWDVVLGTVALLLQNLLVNRMVGIVRIQELEFGVVSLLGQHEDFHLRSLGEYELGGLLDAVGQSANSYWIPFRLFLLLWLLLVDIVESNLRGSHLTSLFGFFLSGGGVKIGLMQEMEPEIGPLILRFDILTQLFLSYLSSWHICSFLISSEDIPS